MNIRPKTIRRLLVLFAAFLILSGAIATWLMLSVERSNAQVAQLRVQAKAAYDAKDYSNAARLFNEFLSRSQSQDTDAEAVFDYGVSQMNTPLEGGRNVYEIIGIFEHYLRLEPADPPDASHRLLKLYTQAHYNKEARTLAEKLLAAKPDDVNALRSLVQSQFNDRNYADALAACRRLNQANPTDLGWQCQELDLMEKNHVPADQIVAHARQLLEQHPDDARFQALMSVAQSQYANDAAGAKQSIEAAARLPVPDADSVLQIVRLLDRQHDVQLADDLLNRAAARDPNAPGLLRLSVQRMWERRRLADLVDRLAHLGPKSSDAEPAVMAYKAMALYELQRPKEAQPLVDALLSRKDDASRAWAIALGARYSPAPLPATESVRRYREAIQRDPSNPVFPFMLGEAYAGEGAADQAVRLWNDAGVLSPSWALPYCLISRSLVGIGRYPDALRAAEIARQRAPGAQAVETAYAVAWYAMDAISSRNTPDAADQKGLFTLVEQIQKVWKNEATTLPIYVALLCRQGDRDQAVRVIREALAGQPPCSVDALTRLAAASGQAHLGLDFEILDQAEKLHGPSAQIALARAMALAQAGKPRDGVQLLDAARDAHPGQLPWQLADARFHDQVGDAGAVKLWTELGDGYPTDLQVQREILGSATRLNDRSLWRRTIDRVKAITGPEDHLWQLEEARWQLAGNPSGKELQAIIASLQQVVRDSPGLPEPHQILAEALQRTGAMEDAARAAAELTTAHELLPGDFQTTARLAELLTGQGLRQKAAALVDEVARQPHLPRDQRLWAAKLYADIGNTAAAMKLLTGADAAQENDPDRDALLAGLYRRSGRLDDASALYRKLLNEPAAGADALAGGAEYFALANQSDLSERFLARLQSMPLNPGTIDIIRAHIAELRGAPKQAIDALVAGAEAHPQAEQVWRELSGFYLRLGQLDEADKAAGQGLKAMPASDTLAAMRTQIARLRVLTPQEAGPLLQVISHDPRHPVATAVIQLMADARARKESPERVLSALGQLAERNAGFLPLQELLVQRYAAAGRLKDAADIASRAGELAPNDPGPLRLLCAVRTASGDWEGARQAALRWRQLSAADPLQPDLTIASTYLQQPNPDAQSALNQLAPYMKESVPPAARDAAIPVYCRALIGAGRAGEASAILGPLLDKSAQWRLVWMELAAAGHKDAADAAGWLNRVIPSIPPDSVMEKLALADAWDQIGSRYDSASAHEAARDVLQPVVTAASAPPSAWAAWATVNQSLGNLPEAERAWRQYLKAVPGEPHVCNNLAYTLLLEGAPEQLAEAEKLSNAAISADPGVSTFYDTFARIQLREGRTDDAVKTFRTALDRGPANVEAMIGLADVLETRPADREEARSLLIRIDAARQGAPPLPAPLRKQLDRVKSALSSSL